MTRDNLLSVGKIIGVHGVQGALKLYPYVESLSLFTSGSRVVLRDSKGNEATYVIKGGSPYKTIYRLAFSEITSRNDAENLIESEVLVEKAFFPIWMRMNITGLKSSDWMFFRPMMRTWEPSIPSFRPEAMMYTW